MRQRTLVVGLLLLLLWLAGTSTTPPAAAQSPASEIIQLVNNFRVANGLPALQINNSLMIAAQQQADYMAANNIYSHTGYGGSSPQSRAEAAGYIGWVSENIVGGTSLTPQKGLIWWQNSAVHYANLVSTRHTEVGAGFASGFEQNFYALVIGNPNNAPAAPSPSNNSQPGAIRVLPFVMAQPGEDGSIVHIVQQGQALWTLAAYYEVNLQDILLFNGLSDGAIVNPGDRIIIRLGEGQSPPPTPMPPTSHIVRAGQTLWYIANLYQVELATLLWYNNLGADAVIQPGQELTIRLLEGQAPPPTPTPQLTYVVKSGDTLLAIAANFRLTLDQLTSWNNITTSTVLRIGQELFIRQPPEPTAVPTLEEEMVAAAPSPTSTPSSLNQPTANVQTQAVAAVVQPTATTTPIPVPDANAAAAEASAPSPSSRPDFGTYLGLGILTIVGAAFLFLQRQ